MTPKEKVILQAVLYVVAGFVLPTVITGYDDVFEVIGVVWGLLLLIYSYTILRKPTKSSR